MILAYIAAGLVILYGIYKFVFKKKKKNIIYQVIPIQYSEGSDAKIIFTLINEIRWAHNLKPLLSDGETTTLATRRNKEMISDGKASHKGAAGEIGTLIKLGADDVGEIIGYKYKTPEACVRAWQKSERHYMQILSVTFDWCGVSVEVDKKGVKWYCVMFGNEDTIN
jgi:uncharacterized protein YkwD